MVFLPVKLKTLVAAVFLMIIVVVVGGLVSLTYRDMAALSSEEAGTRFTTLASNVRVTIRNAIEPGTVMVESIAALPADTMDPEALARSFLAILRSSGSRTSAVTALQVGRGDGSAVLVSNLYGDDPSGAEGGWQALIVEATEHGLTQRLILFDAQGRERSRTEPTPSRFDARTRPWYKLAIESQASVATPPYRFLNHDRVDGLTVAKRSTLRPDIVVGADVALRRLAQSLASARSSFHEDLVIFRSTGEVVARASEEAGNPPQVGEASASVAATLEPPPFFAALFQAFLGRGTGIDLLVSVAARTYFARFEPVLDGTDLITAISLPQDVVLGPAAALRDRELLIGVGAILLAAAVGILASRGLTGPLGQITRTLSEITAFRFTGRTPSSSRVREIADLWRMVHMLERTLRSFACYVPGHLVRRIAHDGALPVAGGVRQQVTVLFTDVEGFTGLSEKMPPEQLLDQMSRYFSTIAAAVVESGGIVDKYIGDSVMAVWNTPVAHPDHVAQACAGTLDAAARIDALNARFRSEGRPTMTTRFGLHTGEAIVGHIGSTDRLNYTVLGHTVNLASRIENLNKQCGTRIIVSEAVQQAAAHAFGFAYVGALRIRGLSEKIRIFRLLAADRDEAPATALPTAAAVESCAVCTDA